MENTPFENPLHFKITSFGITIREDVEDYPRVLTNWYRGPTEQTDVAESGWKYVEIKTNDGERMQVRMGVHLSNDEVRTYSKLLEEYNDVFAWSCKDLKGIPPEVVKHRILLISSAKPIR